MLESSDFKISIYCFK